VGAHADNLYNKLASPVRANPQLAVELRLQIRVFHFKF